MKNALVVGHPGHELRVHHWLETAKPVVLVLTDGSGSINQPRLHSTTRVLETAGARPGPVYGRFTDAQIYRALLDENYSLFQKLRDEIAAWLASEHAELVAGDALEGYNPTHDVCRYVIDAATELASRRLGREIQNYDFPLVGRPDACPPELESEAIRLRLDDAALNRKHEAAQGYPELAGEVEAALNALGPDAFRIECLRPCGRPAASLEPPEQPPHYERHGEKRRREGIYQQVIRYREHLKPLADALCSQS